jgi:hypothetical protein
MVTQAGKKQYFVSANLAVSETNTNICIDNTVLVLQFDKLIVTASLTDRPTDNYARISPRGKTLALVYLTTSLQLRM